MSLTAAALSALMLPFGVLPAAAAENTSPREIDFANWKQGCLFDHDLDNYEPMVAQTKVFGQAFFKRLAESRVSLLANS